MTRDVPRKEKISFRAAARFVGLTSRLRSKPSAPPAAGVDDTPGSSTTEVNSLGLGSRQTYSNNIELAEKLGGEPVPALHTLELISGIVEFQAPSELAVSVPPHAENAQRPDETKTLNERHEAAPEHERLIPQTLSLPSITISTSNQDGLSTRSPSSTSIGPSINALPDLNSTFYPELSDRYDTRLVRISPATTDPDKIECNTKAIALHDDEVYDALSHYWGPPKPVRAIILNGHEFFVREPLFEALKVLRRHGTGWLWIDNLSINQKDALDKERQIGKMNVIYAYANRVLSWLGPQYISQSSSTKDDGEFGVRFLAAETLPDRAPDEREVRAVRAVIDRPYWTRCWIIQEICSSKRVLVMCGSGEAEFTPFWNNLREFFVKYGDPYVQAKMREHFDSLSVFRDQESSKSRKAQMSLIEALLLSRQSFSSIPRDKIFAILRLAHDSNKLVSTPNYTQEDSIIFWKLAHNMINLQGHVAIILLARRGLESGHRPLRPILGHRTHRRHSWISSKDVQAVQKLTAKPLPSWVPLWNALDDPLPDWIIDSVKWEYRSGEPPQTSHVQDVLCVRGVILEYITSISGMPTYPKFTAPEPNGPRSTPLIPAATRQSTIYGGRFRSSSLFQKFWNTVLGPLYQVSGIPPLQHQCGEFGCLCKIDEPEGIAIASVLDGMGTQNGEQSQIIRQWMNVNESLMIGDQTLRAWLKDILTSSYNLRGPSSAKASGSGRRPNICGLTSEVDYLSQAFRMMEKYRMRLAVTNKGMFKLVYCEARVGDAICRIDHCILPVVLRPLLKKPWIVSPEKKISSEPEEKTIPQEEEEETTTAISTAPSETFSSSLANNLLRLQQSSAGASPPPTAAAAKSPPQHEQYIYIGEAFRFKHMTASWADTTYTGWQAKRFDPERWIDLRIA